MKLSPIATWLLTCILIFQHAVGQSLLKRIKQQVDKDINKVLPPKTDTSRKLVAAQQNTSPSGNNAPSDSQNTTANTNSTGNSNLYAVPEQVHLAPGIGDDIAGMNIPIVWVNTLCFLNHTGHHGKNDAWQLVLYDGAGEKRISLNGIIEGFTIEGLQDTMVVSNNKLYIPLYGELSTPETPIKRATLRYARVLLQCDGNVVTQVPMAAGYDIEKPFQFKGQLFFTYYNRGPGDSRPLAPGMGRLATLTTNGIQLITDQSDELHVLMMMPEDINQPNSYPVLYKDKMYFGGTLRFSIWMFDGKNIKVVDDPMKITVLNVNAPIDFPLVYNQKLYFRYMTAALGEFDGHVLKIVDGFTVDDRAMVTPYFIYHNKLYEKGKDSTGYFQLISFDGNKVVRLSNFDPGVPANIKGDTYNDPVFYNNKAYFKMSSGDRSMLEFDGDKIIYIAADNSAAAPQFPILFKGKLYGGVPGHAGEYNIMNINVYDESREQNLFHRSFYNAHSIVFKDRLYFFQQTGYDKARLAYVEPVK